LLSSCSPTPDIPRYNSPISRKSSSPRSTPVKKTSGERARRQSNLEDIKSDQESVSTSSETLLNNKKTTEQPKKNNVPTVCRKTSSLQETGKPVVKRNRKARSVLSVVDQSDDMIEENSDKKTNIAEDDDIKGREICDSKC
jgi:hypothetical protein